MESNAKCSSFRGYFIDVRNSHDCYIKFDDVCISLTREKHWYEIRDEFVPILQGVKFTKCEIYSSKVQVNKS